MQKQNAAGFTLMKFLLVIAIIGILVIVIIPSYRMYTRRAHYTEVVQATAPYKLVIEECYKTTENLSECSAKKWYSSHYNCRQRTRIYKSIDVKDRIITVIPQKNMVLNLKTTIF